MRGSGLVLLLDNIYLKSLCRGEAGRRVRSMLISACAVHSMLSRATLMLFKSPCSHQEIHLVPPHPKQSLGINGILDRCLTWPAVGKRWVNFSHAWSKMPSLGFKSFDWADFWLEMKLGSSCIHQAAPEETVFTGADSFPLPSLRRFI